MAFRREKALEAASKYAAKGQHDKAAREYQSIVENDPKDIRSWLLLADCLVRSGHPAKAIERYNQVARHYADEGHHQKALAVFRQILNLDPSRLDVQVRCGQLFEALRQIPDAVATYERVAQFYLRSGNTREAFSLYAKVAEIEPHVVAKRLRLAELYSREKMVDEAVVEFHRAGFALLDEGKKDEFIRVAERLLYHKKDYDEVLYELIRAYLDTGEPRRALVKLNGLLQRQPTDVKGLELLAEAFVALDKVEKAVSVILELVRDQRERGDSGQQVAESVVRRALKWVPDEPRLVAILRELGTDLGFDDGEVTVAADDAETAVMIGEADDYDLDADEIEELDAEEIEELDDAEFEEVEDLEDAELEDGGGYVDLGGDDLEAPSLTREVMSEGESEELPDAGDLDLDKQLEEIKVLLKYNLFEHALSQLEEVIETSGETPVTLEYRASVFVALERTREAADDYVAAAAVIAAGDPKRASRLVSKALEHVPDHPGATDLQASLGAEAPAPAADAPPAERLEEEVAVAAESEDDYGDMTDAFGSVDFGDDSEIEPEAPAVPAIVPDVDTDVLDGSLGEIADEPDHEPMGYSALEVDRDIGIPGLDRAQPQTLDLDVDAPVGAEDAEAMAIEDGQALALEDEQEAGGLGMDDPEFDDLEEDLGMEDVPTADSGGFAISVQTEDDEAEEELEPIAVEDRFGLPDESGTGSIEAVAAGVSEETEVEAEEVDAVDDAVAEVIEEALEEIGFFLQQGLEDDARAALDDLRAEHGNHPDVVAMVQRLDGTPEEIAEEEALTPAPRPKAVDAAAPLIDLDDDDVEDDDYLSAIFDGGAPEEEEKKVEYKARAQVEGADAGTHFDLGTAYREMGLVDDALEEFESAAQDPRWQAKSLVMMADLLTHQGRTEEAIEKLEKAIETATTGDERSEANYELGVLYGSLGEKEKAIARLESVEAGFRDVEDRLEEFRA